MFFEEVEELSYRVFHIASIGPRPDRLKFHQSYPENSGLTLSIPLSTLKKILRFLATVNVTGLYGY
jgi:hypothetical protein